jgi:hypothetical protein
VSQLQEPFVTPRRRFRNRPQHRHHPLPGRQGTDAPVDGARAPGRIDLTSLITHRFALDDIAAASELFGARRDGVLKEAIRP